MNTVDYSVCSLKVNQSFFGMRQLSFTLEIHTSISHVLFIFSVIKMPKTVDFHFFLVNQSTVNTEISTDFEVFQMEISE